MTRFGPELGAQKISLPGLEELYRSKHGIVVSSLDFGTVDIHSETHLNLEVMSTGLNCDLISLESIRFQPQGCLSCLTTRLPLDIERPRQFVAVMCKPDSYGKFNIMCVMDFRLKSDNTSFQMAINVCYEVGDPRMKAFETAAVTTGNSYYQQRNSNHLGHHQSFVLNGEEGVVKAPKKAKTYVVGGALFAIPKRLPDFKLPRVFEQIVIDGVEEDAINHYPELEHPLCIDNYPEKFQALLYLEEAAMLVRMKAYHMHGVIMMHAGADLVLEVPGLAEKRPSLMLGKVTNFMNLIEPS